MPYRATFRAFAEPGFGPKWTAHARDRWPGAQRWDQSSAAFEEGERTVTLP